MQRITISMDDETAEWLKREARECGISVSELFRRLIDQERPGPRPGKTYALAGMFTGRGLTRGMDIDAELERTWADDIRRDSGLGPARRSHGRD